MNSLANLMKANSESISPEMRLLLACCNPDIPQPDSDPIAPLLAQSLDWELLLKVARMWRLFPLLHERLSRIAYRNVPASARTRVEQLALGTAARNALLSRKIVDILGALAEHGIRALPFKGPALAVQAFGNVSLRRFDDLDFLLPEQDIVPAKDALESIGYRPTLQLSAPERAAHIRAGWGCSLQSPAHDFYVELDTNVGPGFFSGNLNFEHLWQRRCTVSLGTHTVETLSAPDLILLLSVHGAKHLWDRPSWIADMAGLIERSAGLDWNDVLVSAEKTGTLRMVLVALGLVSTLTHTRLPPQISQRIRAEDVAASLTRHLVESLSASPDRTPSQSEIARFHLAIRERLRDKLRYLALAAVTPSYSDWKSVRLPPSLFPLYFAIRPVRLAVRLLLRRSRG